MRFNIRRRNEPPLIFSRVLVAAALFAILLAPGAKGEERYLEFLRALQDRGYSDVALAYARRLRERASEFPEQVQAQLDRIYADVLVDAARTSPPDEAERLLDEAVQVLNAYVAKKRGTPDALDAQLELGVLEMERGNYLAARAAATDDSSLFQQARQHLAAARETFARLLQEGQQLLRQASGTTRKRNDDTVTRLRALIQYARLNHGLTYYYEALTYDPRQGQRANLLKKAIELFDGLYQATRLQLNLITLYAHLWHGRCLYEMGQVREAIDIYDEVLVAEPPSAQNMSREEAELFTMAYVFRLEAMEKLGQLSDIVNHEVYGAEQWLRSHQALRGTPGYAQVQLILARTYLALARQERQQSQRNRLLREALQLLQDAAAVSGPHQAEAARLLNTVQVDLRGTEAQPRRWDEAVALGDLALETRDWKKAISYYEAAFKLPQPGISAAETAAVRYRLAYAYYQSGDAATAAKLAAQVLQEAPSSPVAADAATLALYGQYAILRSARTPSEQEQQFRQFEALANQVLALWPDKPVADLAKYFLGLACWQRRDYQRAAELLSSVRPDFPDYATSLLYAAQALWMASAANSPAPGRISDAQRQQILELARRAAEAAAETNPKIAGEALLLQAQMLLDRQQVDDAKKVTIDAINRLRGLMSPDAAALRTRAYTLGLKLATDSRDRDLLRQLVDEIANAVESGSESVDMTVVIFVVGQLTREYREAQSPAEKEQIVRTLEALLKLLPTEKVTDARTLGVIAEATYVLAEHNGDTALYRSAALLYERLIKASSNMQGTLHYRMRLAACHRALGNYEAAYEQLQQLISASGGPTRTPVSIQMELARTLQEWAAQEPTKMAEAAQAWRQVTELLARRLPRPREYYEALYYLAVSLKELGRRDEARELVQRTLRLSPTCGGPDLKQRFEELLAELETTSGTSG